MMTGIVLFSLLGVCKLIDWTNAHTEYVVDYAE